MKKLRHLIKENAARRERYFQEAEQEIADKNLRLLQGLSLATAGLLLFFFAVTPLIIHGWTMTPQHAFFLPATLTFYAAAVYYRKRGVSSIRLINGLCLLFEVVLFLFIELIDVLQSPDVPASFMPVLCVALPTLFILRFRQTYPLMLIFEVIFVIAAYSWKSPFIARYDVFNSVVGVAFSVTVAQTVMRLRVQDHEVRMKYEQLSTRDSLSGILNKKACKETVEHYLRAHNPNTTCVLMMLDVDDFKSVNDQLGHYTGDILLRAIGELLTETFRSSDTVGRFGGDEFIVLMKQTADRKVLETKCELLRERLQRAVSAEHTFRVTCSIGCVIVDGQEADYDSLFRQADDALYQAKAAGKNRFEIQHYQKN